MTKVDFDALWKFNIVGGDSYWGIAPNRKYSKGYLTNTSSETHLVEFGPTLQLSLSEDFSIYRIFHERGFSLKAEGGGTFGLGDTGSRSMEQERSAKRYGTGVSSTTPEQRDALKTPVDLFTEWLAKGKIYRKLVNLRVPGKTSAKDILGI
jgi:hypothetical protein